MVKLDSPGGSAYLDLNRLEMVGQPFPQPLPRGRKPKKPKLPKDATKLTDEEKAELNAAIEKANAPQPMVRCIFTMGGHKLYILDTPENLARLELDDDVMPMRTIAMAHQIFGADVE
jgi:hypothetical protein